MEVKSSSTISILPELVSGRGTARQSRVVEGQSGAGSGYDGHCSGIAITQDVGRADANRLYARLKEPAITRFVSLWPKAVFMRATVNLDGKSRVAAVEVDNVGAARMLASKFHALWARAQHTPQQHLRQAHRTSKSSRLRDGTGFSLWSRIAKHKDYPSTMLRMVPLPETSSGRI